MANLILAFPNYVLADPEFATVAFDSGGFTSESPLENLLKERLVHQAETYDLDANSTQFWVDLGRERDVRFAGIPRSNGSRTCQLRVRAFSAQSTSSTLIADSGLKELFPPVYPADTLYFGHPSFWDRKLTPEEAKGYPMPWLNVWDTHQIARYWHVSIVDPDNEDGRFRFPKLFLAPGWQPPINMRLGSTIGWNDPTQMVVSLGGGVFYDRRTKKRFATLLFDYLTTNEAFTWPFEIFRRLGTSEQAFFVSDHEDTFNLHRTSFLCTLRELSALEYAQYDAVSAAIRVEEVTS